MAELTLSQAKKLISQLQSTLDKSKYDNTVIKARCFDLLYEDAPEPKEKELKARIIQLEQELREEAKTRLKLSELLKKRADDITEGVNNGDKN